MKCSYACLQILCLCEQNVQHTARIRLFKASVQLALLQFSLYVVLSSVRMCPCMRACRSTCSTVLFCSLKNALDRILVLSRTNNLNYPRCHLEFTIKLVRLAGYQHILGKLRMPSRRRILWISVWMINPFDCALSGPFDNLFHTWFSAPQALCKGIIAVISASTVYKLLNCRNCLNCFHFFNDLILYLAKFV